MNITKTLKPQLSLDLDLEPPNPDLIEPEQYVIQMTEISDKHLSLQSVSVQDIIHLCSFINGNETLCFQINSLCNDILMEEINFTEQLNKSCANLSAQLVILRQQIKTVQDVKPKESPKESTKRKYTKSPKKNSKIAESAISKQEVKKERTKSSCADDDTGKDNVIEDDDFSSDKEIDDDDDNDDVQDDIEEDEDDDDDDDDVHDDEDYTVVVKKHYKKKSPKKVFQDEEESDVTLDPVRKYQCDTCGKKYQIEVALEKHKQQQHGAEPLQLVCKHCQKESATLSVHLAHERTHTQERPVCEICGASCKNSHSLRSHLLTHTDFKPIACDLCDFRCRKRSILKFHRMRHTGERNYTCEECGKTFIRLQGYKRHKIQHKDKTPYPCSICGKRFANASHVNRHKKIHESDEMYSCEVCGHQSRQRYNITVHMRTHTKEKPYTCSNCGEKFTYTVTLQQHKKSCDMRKLAYSLSSTYEKNVMSNRSSLS